VGATEFLAKRDGEAKSSCDEVAEGVCLHEQASTKLATWKPRGLDILEQLASILRGDPISAVETIPPPELGSC
jgi:hypothetical protein